MKQIDFENLNEKNGYLLFDFLERGVNMEFIKKGQNYLIKDSGGKIVSEKEKLQLEKNELIFKDVDSSNCQKETTKKISKINKKLKQLESNDIQLSKEQKELSKMMLKDAIDKTSSKIKEHPIFGKAALEIENSILNDTIQETDKTV